MRRFSRSTLVAIATLALSAAAADAQTIGFKLGAAMSNLSIDERDDTDRTTSFMGGGFVRFDFGRLGIQPEILSVRKGAEFEVPSGEDETLSIEYIAIPILLHLPLTYGSAFAPYILGGPEIAFDIGCEFTAAGTEIDCDSEEMPDGPIARKSIDVGLSAGGGVAFAMGPGALLLEGRYTWGLTNIDDTPDPVDIKNRSAYFLAGYSIPLGRGY